MDKQQLEEIRARDADDYATVEVLRNIRRGLSTDPELDATINMIADRHALLSAYDALRSRLAEAEALLRDVLTNIGAGDHQESIEAFLAADSAEVAAYLAPCPKCGQRMSSSVHRAGTCVTDQPSSASGEGEKC